jgi:hypothetical protein
MKSRVRFFVSSFILYAIGFLLWHNWILTTKEIAEMIFIGTLSSLIYALNIDRIRRLITRIVEKVVTK